MSPFHSALRLPRYGLPCLAASALLSSPALAQEALRNSLAGDAAAEAGRLRPEAQQYNYKLGDFRLMVTPSVALEWNDNLYLVQEHAQDDFILRPTMGVAASYPVTQRNLLRLDVSIGYNEYFRHHDLSALYIGANSGLSFDLFVKDWRFNLHDWFNYSVAGTQQRGEVAGTGNYSLFQNTAGLAGTWDLEDLVPTLGFDHVNASSPSGAFQQQNRTTESGLARIGARVHPRLTAGVEGTVSSTAYQEKLLNDNIGYSGGVYADWRPGNYISVQPRGGYAAYNFQQTSAVTPASNVDSWYVDLTVRHRPTEVVSYGLSVGHELMLGLLSDGTDDYYVRPSVTWGLVKNVTLTTSLFYEHGKLVGGLLPGASGGIPAETFDWFGAGLDVGYSPMKRLTVGLYYRPTLRSSDLALRSYAQNIVGLRAAYTP